MKIKFNWGTGIFITLIAIIGFLAFLVDKTFDYTINKVSDDYYEKGLNHSQHMKRAENSFEYKDGFNVVHTDVCTVEFPEFFIGKDITGEILFFRPSNYMKDKTFDIKLDTAGKQVFGLEHFLKGKYIVRATFSSEQIDYFLEKDIIF